MFMQGDHNLGSAVRGRAGKVRVPHLQAVGDAPSDPKLDNLGSEGAS